MCDEKTLREVFNHFDKDKSGTIDMKELKDVMKAYFEAVGEAADAKKVDDTSAVSVANSVDCFGICFNLKGLLTPKLN